MRPTFGCNLRGTLFDNISPELTADIEETIRDNFEVYLPYININELRVQTSTSDPNRLDITLTISLKGNETQTRDISVQVQSEFEV